MKRVTFTVYVLISFLMLMPQLVMAQQGGRIRFGNLKVIPGITLQEVYDDNIFLANDTNNTDELKESDFIFHLMPSLMLQYNIPGRGGLNFGYQGQLAYYGDRDENDWQTHKGLFNVDYYAPGGFILGIKEVYSDAEDPFGSPTEFGLGKPQTKRKVNDLMTKIGYDFGNKTKVLAFFNYYDQDYDAAADFTQDHDINEFGVGLQIRLLPKTWAFARWHFGEQDYNTSQGAVTEANDSDNDWHRINTGLTWDSGAKLQGELNFGYQWKDHDNPFDSNGAPFGDEDTWIAATAITYLPTKTTTLSLNVSRTVRVTSASTREFFEDTAIGLNLRQKLMNKLSLSLGGRYSFNEYNLPVANPREDDNYDANIGLDYLIQKWLKAGLSYSYKKKDSNDVAMEFTDNQVVLLLSAAY